MIVRRDAIVLASPQGAALSLLPSETALLNFYRASHLHAGLILGQTVRRTRDPRLILSVTRHSAEEVMHAQMWTETIMAIGGRPALVRDTYHTRYADVVGTPRTLLDVLVLTHVFERRMYRHFTLHLALPALHPAVTTALRRLLEDERGHLSWVKAWLDEQAKERRNMVRDAMRRYVIADQRIYHAMSTEYQLTWTHGAELQLPLLGMLPEREGALSSQRRFSAGAT